MTELLKTKTSHAQCNAGTWCVILCYLGKVGSGLAEPYLRRISNSSPCSSKLKLSTFFLNAYVCRSETQSSLNKQHICRRA
jgi:hypothetical protein